MDNTDEQLHPNWRALATVQIRLKRFIKEGHQDVQKGTDQKSKEKCKISGVKGEEIKEFYEELVNKETETKTVTQTTVFLRKDYTNLINRKLKATFEVKTYFRLAMENRVNELKQIDLIAQDLNVCDSFGWTALMMASCEGAYEVVEYLLSLGVDKTLKDRTGKTAMDLAQKKGHYKILELLENYQDNKTKSIDCNELNEVIEPFFCEICKQNFKETSQSQHQTSTIHQFNMKSTLPANKLQKFNIPERNKGLKLMVKQGWDKESGLGPSQKGRLYPVKTVIRKQRTGLGIEQETARVTHFEAFDLRAIKRKNSDYYRKKPRNRNDIKMEKVREWKRDRRLRNELN